MKKIPTLFERIYEGHKIVGINDTIHEGCEEAFLNGTATEKFDGACCAIINGDMYKRYDAKKGRKVPEGAIPCQEKPDEITGHWPYWVKCDPDNPNDKWFLEALKNLSWHIKDGTYEAIGPHFQGNPYELESDILVYHGEKILEDVPRSFEGIREYLREHYIEGAVFWYQGEPVCKIKRTDFGFEWGNKK